MKFSGLADGTGNYFDLDYYRGFQLVLSNGSLPQLRSVGFSHADQYSAKHWCESSSGMFSITLYLHCQTEGLAHSKLQWDFIGWVLALLNSKNYWMGSVIIPLRLVLDLRWAQLSGEGCRVSIWQGWRKHG